MSALAAKQARYDLQIKLLLVGYTFSGKTNVLLRYADDTFSTSNIATIGIDFRVKTIKMFNKSIKLQIWDSAGLPRFATITNSYFRGAQGVAIVYDVADSESFEAAKDYIWRVKKLADEDVQVLLIANRVDTVYAKHPVRNEPLIEEGEALAAAFGIPFFLTSAKLNINIDEAFAELTRLVVMKQHELGRLPVDWEVSHHDVSSSAHASTAAAARAHKKLSSGPSNALEGDKHCRIM